MLDFGSTPDWCLMAVDVYLSGMDYLGIDWDSELGQRLQQLMRDVNEVLPRFVQLVDDPE